jgi:hypothetical protein
MKNSRSTTELEEKERLPGEKSEFTMIYNCCLHDSRLNTFDKIVYIGLLSYSWIIYGKRNDLVYPSITQLSKTLKIGRPKVIQSLRALQSINYIDIQKTENGKRNQYRLLQVVAENNGRIDAWKEEIEKHSGLPPSASRVVKGGDNEPVIPVAYDQGVGGHHSDRSVTTVTGTSNPCDQPVIPVTSSVIPVTIPVICQEGKYITDNDLSGGNRQIKQINENIQSNQMNRSRDNDHTSRSAAKSAAPLLSSPEIALPKQRKELEEENIVESTMSVEISFDNLEEKGSAAWKARQAQLDAIEKDFPP